MIPAVLPNSILQALDLLICRRTMVLIIRFIAP